ncbi:hypothetical protein LTR66_000259 [Elasticomyces elasticus]|nr:hypothetical protein LTR66_000259 [Elasticomyces elasticus]
MATMANLAPGAFDGYDDSDPFVSTASHAHPVPHRYTSFDNNLFSLYSSDSPSQAKRALEARMKDTDRRIQDASRLGTALLQQRKDLSARLKEVEQQRSEGEIGPELRKKLIEIEREYNEIGKESARALLPKSRVPDSEDADSSRSPSVLSSDWRASPSKVSAPSRKQRNQPSSRVHDIEFATEISTSLLAQVRQLQGVLADREETLRQATLDKTHLEAETAAYVQRLRHMDENEQRYKDENWNLETQLQELTAFAKEAATKEQRLAQSIKLAEFEKAAAQRELDDLRQSHGKLSEDHASIKKQQETELAGLRRNITTHESDKSTLQRKIEDLTAQNAELARAVAQRWNVSDQPTERDLVSNKEEVTMYQTTPENSPPPSPTKGTPRHGVLESETLKSSLHHAHRMIQNLKNNIHREKTEKTELKRMLQDSRDELESRRRESGAGAALQKKRKTEPDNVKFRKPLRPDRLGASRSSKEEITVYDDWEDHDGQATPSKSPQIGQAVVGAPRSAGGFDHTAFGGAEGVELTDAFETANEHEMTNTETEGFQTGVETFGGNSSEDLTETEGGVQRNGTLRASRPSPLVTGKAEDTRSYQSTASTSEDEADKVHTPIQARGPKYKLRINRDRASLRRSSNFGGAASSASGSPAVSLNDSNHGTPMQEAQSLDAELAELSEGDSTMDGTPGRLSVDSTGSSPEAQRQSGASTSTSVDAAPTRTAPPQMIDSGMMTEPWEPEHKNLMTEGANMVKGAIAASLGFGLGRATKNESAEAPEMNRGTDKPIAGEEADMMVQASAPAVAVQTTQQQADRSTSVEPNSLTMPSITTQGAELGQNVINAPAKASSQLSTIVAQETVPVHSISGHSNVAPSQLSRVVAQVLSPVSPLLPATASKPGTQATPSALASGEKQDSVAPALAPSSIISQDTVPSVAEHWPTLPRRSSRRYDALDPAKTPLLDQASDVLATPPEPIHTDSDRVPTVPGTAATKPGAAFFSSLRGRRSLSLLSRSSATDRTVAEEPPLVSTPKKQPASLPPQEPGTAETVTAREPQLFGGTPSPQSKAPVLQTARDDHLFALPSAEESSARGPSFTDVVPSITQTEKSMSNDSMVPTIPPLRSKPTTADEGTQTMMSADEIENLFTRKGRTPTRAVAEEPDVTPTRVVSGGSSPGRSSERVILTDIVPVPPLRRPVSTGSVRKASASAPPLPPDHTQKIAAAAQQKAPLIIPPAGASGMMGPPGMPASAYKAQTTRSRTPSNANTQASQSHAGGTTPRPRAHTGRDVSQAPSGRTSVSSFASELDDRFNITRNGIQYPPDAPHTTDPRMIQAITQTMIGEYLWKYTRKAGRSETSSTRHRRFFWVHPYTRTLYWSEQDPSTAGMRQLKAKSVAIESVRVISDDNPMPPGLHRKSIIIVTPGREVVFTAPTGQRHETWFNSLSYLLLRTGQERGEETNGITQEDIEEFHPGGFGRSISRMTQRSRASLSSYNSRTTRTSSPQRIQAQSQFPSLAQRQSEAATRSKRAITPTPNIPPVISRNSQAPNTANQGSMSGRLSSLSGFFRPPASVRGSIRGSFSSKRSRTSFSMRKRDADVNGDPIYDASVVGESAEDLRAVIERQEREADRLENVRACCDGKHDVGSLSRNGRHSSMGGRHTHTHAHPRAEPIAESSRPRRGE